LLKTLTSPNSQFNGHFGESVAISGTTIAIGAPFETVSGDSAAGHAYVFDAKTGKLLKTLTSPNVQADGWFGYTVAISGTTVVVGAPTETDAGFPGAGNTYVFKATTGALLGNLTDPNPVDDGNYGISVAISGTTAVVGEYGYSAGAAYIFNTTDDHLTRNLTSPNAVDGGEFGGSVAIAGTTVVVGALAEEPSGDYLAGRAYIFDAKTGGLIATLTSPNVQLGSRFATSVAVNGATVVVGAPGENVSGVPGDGHVYLFKASTGGLITTLTSPNATMQGSGWFGFSAALSGTTVIVGAPYQEYLGHSQAGHAYIFKGE
jgi:hypothetical protein